MPETIWIQKNSQNQGDLMYKKALMSEHRKIYILRDINYFVTMSFSTLTRYQILCLPSISKTSLNIKTKFHMGILYIAFKS